MLKTICGILLIITSIRLLTAQTTESLLIGAGDVVRIHVFDTPELEQRTRVNDSGEVLLIIGGPVKITGLTPAGAAHAIELALEQRHVLKKPLVQVNVEEYATERVSVVGEIRNPGAYQLLTPRSILDVLGLAGGLTELADRQIIIERNGTSDRVSYFFDNNPNTALDSAPKVYPGDTVLVAKAAIVYALGDVKIAGGYAMTTNESKLSVLELVSRAGGTPPTAVPSHARIIRRTETGFVEIPIPLSDMQKGKKPDIELKPNDIVYVPFSYLRNLVTNASGIAASAANAAVYRF